MSNNEGDKEIINRKVEEIKYVIRMKERVWMDVREKTACNIFFILLEKYWYLKNANSFLRNFALKLEEKQFRIFSLFDYLNEELFLSKFIFTLFNHHKNFKYFVDINSKEFMYQSSNPTVVNTIKDFTGWGIYFLDGDDLSDNNFMFGYWKNGWLTGKVRIYDRFYQLLDEIDNYEKCFDNYLDSISYPIEI